MANEVSIFKDPNAVVSSKPRKSMLAEKVARSGPTFRRIQTNTNGTFKRLIDGEQVGESVRGEINIIVVNQSEKVSRIFYANKYDPDAEPTIPNCWSNDGIRPEAGAPDKQSLTCVACPQNIKGSGEGADRRACRFQRRISVLLEGDTSGDVYQLNIPAKSLFGKSGSGKNTHHYEKYYRFLENNNEALDTVVTTVSYDSNADSMELLFTPVRTLTEEENNLVLDAQARPETEMYTQLTVAQADGVSAQPKTITVAAKGEPTTLMEEPTKVKKTKGKAKPTPVPEKDLADIVKDWETE
jgi:hypothetical protein